MTVPTLEKTWQFQTSGSVSTLNQQVGGFGATLADNQDLLYKIKNSLKSFSSNPWTVWGSSDGSANFGNNDGVDWWTQKEKLVWAASGNHSWIVLKQVGGWGASPAICFDLLNANSYVMNAIYMPTGPSVIGSLTARPTAAADEYVFSSATSWGGVNGAWFSKGLNMMQSSDGQCTRVILCRSNIATCLWMFDLPKSPLVGWTHPYFCHFADNVASPSNQLSYANLNDAANTKTKYGTSNLAMYMTSSFYGSATVGENQTVPDDNSSEWPINSIGLACTSTPHRGARKGEVYDLFWGSTGIQIGTTYPEDGSKLFAQFGHLIFPWDGSTTPRFA